MLRYTASQSGGMPSSRWWCALLADAFSTTRDQQHSSTASIQPHIHDTYTRLENMNSDGQVDGLFQSSVKANRHFFIYGGNRSSRASFCQNNLFTTAKIGAALEPQHETTTTCFPLPPPGCLSVPVRWSPSGRYPIEWSGGG